jgi:hypothetical protein
MNKRILLTGGLGDFLACEAYWSDAEIDSVEEIVWAARGKYGIEQLVEVIFPNLKKQTVLWDKWCPGDIPKKGEVFGIVDFDHLARLNRSNRWGLNLSKYKDVTDWSIRWLFGQIMNGERKFVKTRLWDKKFADISGFSLPEEFVVINPYSPNARQGGRRDFTPQEWNAVIEWLHKKNLSGIVINRSDDLIPMDDSLIDFNNRTSVSEGVEICKQGSYFIGVDSWIPAFMTRKLEPNRLAIKSVNDHYMRYQEIYCAPHKNINFIQESLERICL